MPQEKTTNIICEICRAFFTKPHDYPVVCNTCWKKLPASERHKYKPATHPKT